MQPDIESIRLHINNYQLQNKNYRYIIDRIHPSVNYCELLALNKQFLPANYELMSDILQLYFGYWNLNNSSCKSLISYYISNINTLQSDME